MFMPNVHHISGSNQGLTVTAYRGDGSVLLGFDIDPHLTKNLAGFAIQVTSPDGKSSWLKNRLSFDKPLTSRSTPQQRQEAWTDSNKAPFQKFRWQAFPPTVMEGPYSYEATAMYFNGKDGKNLDTGPAVQVDLNLLPADFGNFQIGFTRSYVSSQAYASRFGNKPLRPEQKSLDYATASFEDQYKFLGYSARKLIFDFLNEAVSNKAISLDAFVYDIDEPDIVRLLQKLGKRLRIFMDNAPLHTESTALEPEVERRLQQSAGTANVKTGHFSRFAHYKVFVQRQNGKPVKVLTGSANFSVRGLYVQANNVLVFDDPDVAKLYGDVFDQVWKDPTTKAFASSAFAKKWSDKLLKAGLPPCAFCFSPHKDANVSLKQVADAIDAAKSSVLFAVMQLSGGGSVMQMLKAEAAKNPDLFWYGVTQNVSEKKAKDGTTEQTTGVTVRQASGKQVLVPFAFLHGNVPEPFNKEVNGGPGQVIHNKFVVVDFNDQSPAVFTGSSNLAAGGEKSNGDNLLGVYDRAIVTMYGVEAIRLVDHYQFRAALKGAKSKPLMLRANKEAWWEPYFDEKDARCSERLLFVL
jgi:phosphatidylserine/phosphatidylglycerophosphate/cardiolipin synthase-like enzyme